MTCKIRIILLAASFQLLVGGVVYGNTRASQQEYSDLVVPKNNVQRMGASNTSTSVEEEVQQAEYSAVDTTYFNHWIVGSIPISPTVISICGVRVRYTCTPPTCTYLPLCFK